MLTTLAADTCRRAFADIACVKTAAGLENFKLDRLLELRAVIDSLRAQSEPPPAFAGHGARGYRSAPSGTL